LGNRVSLLWAAAKMPNLISSEQRAGIISDALARQNPDGGWSTAVLIPTTWLKRDGTSQALGSDGYGTGMVAFMLEQAGVPSSRPALRRALEWLARNQDPATGAWPTPSPNVTRDPNTDVGKFMTDAATAYAAMALARR
jgi:hypothetical protein